MLDKILGDAGITIQNFQPILGDAVYIGGGILGTILIVLLIIYLVRRV